MLEAAAIIWAAGVAASPSPPSLGVPTDRGGRITPNPDLSVPGYPDIFVAGDLVSMKDCDDQMVPGVAPAAVADGAPRRQAAPGRTLEKPHADRKPTRPHFRYRTRA